MRSALTMTLLILGLLLGSTHTATADTPPPGTTDYDQCKKWKEQYTDALNQWSNPLLTCRYIGGTTSVACQDKLDELYSTYRLTLRLWNEGNCVWWDSHPQNTSADIFGFEWYMSVLGMYIPTLGTTFPGMDTPISWP